MNWPLVSRWKYDSILREAVFLKQWLDKALEERNALILRLTQPPATPPLPPMVATSVWQDPPSRREPDPVAQVIREQAISDGREDLALAAHLRKYALQLKREGLSPDAIVGKLVAWQSTETEPAYDKVG